MHAAAIKQPPDDPLIDGGDLAVEIIRTVCQQRGVDAAVQLAIGMISASAAIVAEEAGTDAAIEMLKTAIVAVKKRRS